MTTQPGEHIILFGTGGSGKSTIYGIITGSNYPTIYKMKRIFETISSSFKRFIEKYCDKITIQEVFTKYGNLAEDLQIPKILEAKYWKFLMMYHDSGFQKKIAERTIENIYESELNESVTYLTRPMVMDRILNRRMLADDFARIYSKTVGIVDKEVKGVTFYDTGGQRGERKKWENYYDIPGASLCFVISLAQFNENCYEDFDLKRFYDSLQALRTLLERKDVSKMYLIFTKFDLMKRLGEVLNFHHLLTNMMEMIQMPIKSKISQFRHF